MKVDLKDDRRTIVLFALSTGYQCQNYLSHIFSNSFYFRNLGRGSRRAGENRMTFN